MGDGDGGGGAHQRVEIAPGGAIGQVAVGVADIGLYQGKVGFQPAFLHVGSAVEVFDLLAVCKIGAKAGGGVEGRNARAAGTDTFRQRALRHQFQVDLACQIKFGEHHRIGRARERADQLFHHASLDQRRQPDVAVARVVVDDRQLCRMAGGLEAINQGVDQFYRRARAAEPADHHHRAITNSGDRGGQIGNRFVHSASPMAVQLT